MAFLGFAVASVLIYAAWAFWVPLLPDNLFVPLLDLGKITGYRWSSAGIYLAIVAGLYALYGFGYYLVASDRARSFAAILCTSVGFCAVMVLAYPATAVDVFGYIAHGRLLALHNVNPFVTTPGEFPQDEIVRFLAYPGEPSQYGPLWVLLDGGFAALAQGSLLVETLLYKVLAAIVHVATGVLIYFVACELHATPSRARACAFLFLCNPMLIWEMVANAHNDGLMMLFGLFAVWLLLVRVDLLVLPALAAGALIKVPVAVIGPLLFIALWRRSWARAVEGVALALALAAAVYRPFWQGPETLTALRRTDLFTASLGSVLRLALLPSFGLVDASSIARAVSLSAFAVIFVLCLVFALRAGSERDYVRLAYFTLLGALLLATTWFQAWYVVWPFAIGAALPEARRHAELALLSLGGLLQYFVFIYLWVIGVFPPSENLAVQSAAYLAIIGPLAVWVALRSVRRPWRASA